MSSLQFIGGDKVVETMVSREVMLGMLVGYLGMIAALRSVMKGRAPYSLKLAMQVYNVIQVALNVYMIWGLAVVPQLKDGNIFGINLKYSATIEWFVYVHYLSKFLDFFDTAFIILRGKDRQQLSFLHVYHHASIGMIWGTMLFIGHGNGTASFGCLINSIIHCIMYSHYLYTSFGLVNPFKKLITQAQLFQFATCIVHAVCVLAWETVLPRPLAWAQFVYHIQMLVLFGHFYRKSYIAAKEARKQKAAAVKADQGVKAE
mmetsp:Transcript_21281/g.53405  ORF Transcript_21281/g.53405 Transcript_21281/m.53405 type:complete len:260 (-) Transcript_21281:217-996(-)